MKAEDFWAGAGAVLMWGYFTIAAIHGIFFEWVYWNTHGPVAGFLFGTFVAGLKALVWPLWYLI